MKDICNQLGWLHWRVSAVVGRGADGQCGVRGISCDVRNGDTTRVLTIKCMVVLEGSVRFESLKISLSNTAFPRSLHMSALP